MAFWAGLCDLTQMPLPSSSLLLSSALLRVSPFILREPRYLGCVVALLLSNVSCSYSEKTDRKGLTGKLVKKKKSRSKTMCDLPTWLRVAVSESATVTEVHPGSS